MSNTEPVPDDSSDTDDAELDTGPERTGQQVGNYRLGRRLGSGGMAEVYEAHRTDELEGCVAIKVLHASYAHIPEYRKRFEEEALTLSKLKDPGVVGIIDFVKQDNNEAFLVMDYLDGTSLATYLKEQPEHRLSVDTALRFCAQAASTLHSIHKLNIIHRDLKPGNLMLVADPAVPGGNRIKIVDFGIARSTGRKRDQAPALTAKGVAIGTLRYMSPEQLDARTVDTYSDVYSLGVVLFECLTGQLPFVGNEAAVRIQILNAEAPTLLSICPTAPPQLSQLLRRMLAKVAGDRPNMSEVEQALIRLRSELSQKQLLPMEKRNHRVPPAGPVSVKATKERKKDHWLKRQGRYFAPAIIILTAVAATWGFRSCQHRTQQTQQPPTAQPPASPGVQLPSSRAAQPSSDSSAPVPSGPVISTVEERTNMVRLRADRSFMIGSNAHQMKEAVAQCKIQRKTPGLAMLSGTCNEDGFALEGPRHPVSIDAYLVDKYPVQVESFVAFLNGQGPGRSIRKDTDSHQPRFVMFKNMTLLDLYEADSGILYDAKKQRFSFKKGFATQPVKYVSWFGALQYCKDRGKRLPTEVEYEYAAFHNNGAVSASTGLALPGPTSEWVYDPYEGSYPSCLDAPCSAGDTHQKQIENTAKRVVRGCDPTNELPAYCRITARTGANPEQGYINLTFRCALTAQ